MFARQGAAQLHDRAQHLLTRGLDLVQDLAVAKVEKDVGMQVAVAGVEHVRHRKLVVLADLAHRGQHLGQPGPRDHAVVQVVVGLDPPERPDRALAAGPQELALRRRLRFSHRVALVPGEDVGDRVHQLARGFGDAVDLDQQNRARIGRIARVVMGLDRAHGDFVHHLERGGHDPVPDHRGHRLARRFDAREGRQ